MLAITFLEWLSDEKNYNHCIQHAHLFADWVNGEGFDSVQLEQELLLLQQKANLAHSFFDALQLSTSDPKQLESWIQSALACCLPDHSLNQTAGGGLGKTQIPSQTLDQRISTFLKKSLKDQVKKELIDQRDANYQVNLNIENSTVQYDHNSKSGTGKFSSNTLYVTTPKHYIEFQYQRYDGTNYWGEKEDTDMLYQENLSTGRYWYTFGRVSMPGLGHDQGTINFIKFEEKKHDFIQYLPDARSFIGSHLRVYLDHTLNNDLKASYEFLDHAISSSPYAQQVNGLLRQKISQVKHFPIPMQSGEWQTLKSSGIDLEKNISLRTTAEFLSTTIQLRDKFMQTLSSYKTFVGKIPVSIKQFKEDRKIIRDDYKVISNAYDNWFFLLDDPLFKTLCPDLYSRMLRKQTDLKANIQLEIKIEEGMPYMQNCKARLVMQNVSKKVSTEIANGLTFSKKIWLFRHREQLEQLHHEYKRLVRDYTHIVKIYNPVIKNLSALTFYINQLNKDQNTYSNSFKTAKRIDKDFSWGGKYHNGHFYTKAQIEKYKKKTHNQQKQQINVTDAEKLDANHIAKREELFWDSINGAVIAAQKSFKQSYDGGKGKSLQESLDIAFRTYVDTLAKEDKHYIINNESRLKTFVQKQYKEMNSPFFSKPGDFKMMEEIGADILLSIGSDILLRQAKTVKKFWHFAHMKHRRIALLTAQEYLLELQTENAIALRYQAWYAKHPLKKYHGFDEFFKHLGRDIWFTLTLPYRCISAEINVWKNGGTFWQGISAGFKKEGQIMHMDVKDFNCLVLDIEKTISWIPDVGKVLDGFNMIGRALESIPFNIAKDVKTLSVQLWKVFSVHSWKGIKAGIGRDTKSFRHLVRDLELIITGQWKQLYKKIHADVIEIDHVAHLYFHKKQIKAAIKIEQFEINVAKFLNVETHGIIRPVNVILAKQWKHSQFGKRIDSNYTEKYNQFINKNFAQFTKLQQLDFLIELQEHNGKAEAQTKKYVHKTYPKMTKTLLKTDVNEYLNTKIQDFVMDGGLVKLAISIDDNTLGRLKKAIASPKIHKDLFWAYADNREINRFIHYYYHAFSESLIYPRAEIAYKYTVKALKIYHNVNQLIQENWDLWGKTWAKVIDVAYFVSLRPKFTINTATTPPTVTCSNLSFSDKNTINKHLQSEHAGRQIFYDLLWASLIRTELTLPSQPDDLTLAGLNEELYFLKHLNSDFKSSSLVADYQNLREIDSSFVQASPVNKWLQHRITEMMRQKFDLPNFGFVRAVKRVKQEILMLEIVSLPLSLFSKANYHIFESHRFYNLKLLELQSALYYDFHKTSSNSKNPPSSRVSNMMASMSHHHQAQYNVWMQDKAQQKEYQSNGGTQGFTVGQILMTELTTAPVDTSNNNSSNSTSGGSSSASGSGANDHSDSSNNSVHPSGSGANDGKTANLLMLVRNFFLIKHLLTKNPKYKEVVVDEVEQSELDELAESYRPVEREEILLEDDLETIHEVESELEESLDGDTEKAVKNSLDDSSFDSADFFDTALFDEATELDGEVVADELAVDAEISTAIDEAALL